MPIASVEMTFFAGILAIVHWLLRVWASLIVIWFRLLAVVRLPALSRSTVDSVRRHLAAVDRIPIHVSLVFVEDDISLTDVAKLVVWSVVAGIAYITIYDHRGIYLFLFIYPRRKDHVATYTVGKSTNIITCTETQSQRMKNKRKHYMKN